MSNIIQAEYTGLQQASSKFEAESDNILNTISAIDRCFEELREGWMGEDARQFQAEMENIISPALKRLQVALDTANAHTNDMEMRLASAEQEASGQITCVA